jgi:hypothetical protein
MGAKIGLKCSIIIVVPLVDIIKKMGLVSKLYLYGSTGVDKISGAIKLKILCTKQILYH